MALKLGQFIRAHLDFKMCFFLILGKHCNNFDVLYQQKLHSGTLLDSRKRTYFKIFLT